MQTTSLDRFEAARATPNTHSSLSSRRRSIKAPQLASSLFTPSLGAADYREQTHETSISIQLWHPNQATTSASTLSKAPLLREVPQVKRKLTRRDRDSSTSETRSFQSLKSAAPSWLRERPSRQKLAGQFSPNQQGKGVWKRATAICRETGALLLYGEDRALVHSISIRELSETDIRLVDDSLFVCPNVLGIFSRPSTLTAGLRSPQMSSTSKAPAASSTGKEEPIYLCFPTSRKMKKWRGLLRIFAKPEIYGAREKGGSHRCYRQVDLSILEAKLAINRPVLTVRPGIVSSPSFDLEDDQRVGENVNSFSKMSISGRGGGVGLPREASARASQSMARSDSNISTEAQGRTGEKTTSLYDDSESDKGATTGPISGVSGRERILDGSSVAIGGSSYEMERKTSDGVGTNSFPTACYCVVWMANEVVAQTKVRSGLTNMITWFDTFTLKDLPNLVPIQIDVMQSGRNGKFSHVGTVSLPMDTMRRGEKVEGWYPIWSLRPRETEAGSHPMEPCYGDEMVGELKLCITLAEETVLPLRKYAKVAELLEADDSITLVKMLCKQLQEERVIAHLVDIHTSKGTIVHFLSDLTEAESATFGENSGPTLLFRGNTLLTRAVDKYQRLYCKDWLDACVGPTVRRICHDRIWLEANDSHHYYHTPIHMQEGVTSSLNASASASSQSGMIVGESNLDALQRLCTELWNNIYANRHRCPRDLRSALSHIRTTVNARFQQFNHVPGPGIQGVGAFVFLRLICPAITTPNLYGLMGNAPNASCCKTLMLVAKVFLALANRRTAFDQDKEPWLVKANAFLAQHATAYDDFITFVSTEPASYEAGKEPLGDEADGIFQELMEQKINRLTTLHRESIPSPAYMLDSALALASLVSYVVRGASLEAVQEQKGHPLVFQQQQSRQQGDETQNVQEMAARYDHFIDVCCDVEDQAGYYLDRAGYQPEPIEVGDEDQQDSVGVSSTLIYTALTQPHLESTVRTALASPSRLASTAMRATQSSPSSIRARRATVSDSRRKAEEAATADEQRRPTMSSIGEDSLGHGVHPHRIAAHFRSTTGVRLSLDDALEDVSRRSPHRAKGAKQENSRVIVGGGGDGGATNSSRGDQGQQHSSGPHALASTAAVGSSSRDAGKRTSFSDQRMALPGAGGGRARASRESIEEGGRGVPFDTVTPDDRYSVRKMKRSWWKK